MDTHHRKRYNQYMFMTVETVNSFFLKMEYNNCFLVMSILHIYIPVVPIFTNHQFTWCVILPPYTSLCNTAPRQRKLIFVVICICFFFIISILFVNITRELVSTLVTAVVVFLHYISMHIFFTW